MAGICNGGGGGSSIIIEAIKNWNKLKFWPIIIILVQKRYKK